MPPPRVEAAPDVDAADEAAARRAMQIVSGLLQSSAPGAPLQQHGKPQFQQGNREGGHGKRKRRRRRGRGGREGYPNQPYPNQPGNQQGPRPQNQPFNRPQNPPAAQFPRPQQPPVSVPAQTVLASEAPPVVAAQAPDTAVLAETPALIEAVEVQNIAAPETVVEGDAAAAPAQAAPQQSNDRRPWKQKNGQPRWRESTYESSSVAPQVAPVNVRKVVLLNATEPGEVRVAILENGELAEIFMERKSHGQQAGNIYKGRVVNVEPSLQAAFVDLGAERNGFLHASDCIPPDGGYSDVLVKPTRHGRSDSRDNRDNWDRGGRPQQPKTETPAAQPVAVSAPVVATEQAPQQAVAATVPNGTPVQSQPGVPAQQGTGQNNGGKRRRRRRGGRGRSGRGRPSGPAPMLAPMSGGSSESTVTPAANIETPVSVSAAPVDSMTAPVATEAAPSEPSVEPRESIASTDTAPATVSSTVAENQAMADVPATQTVLNTSDADSASDADDEDEDSDESNESTEASQPEPASANESVEQPREEAPAEPRTTTDSGEASSAADAPAAESEPQAASVERFEEPSQESTDAEEEAMDAAEASAIHESSGENTQGSVNDSGETPAAASGEETQVSAEELAAKQAESESIRESAPIPAPGQPVPVLASPERRHDRGGRSGRERPNDRRYTVQEMLREGQEVLVQVAKEGIGQKGPALTTYLSMPGRYLVLMPAVQRLGVSKRIDNEEQRRALKDALNQLNPPDDMGVIVRTAGTGRSKDELQRDMDYLVRIWETLKKKAQSVKAPALIYQEGDVVTRVFRDVITDDVAEIVIDDPGVLERAKEFLRETAPGTEHKLKLYSEPEPLFHKYGVEQQMQRLFNRKVNMKSGGSIVIEQTEALVAIDVNTGRFREKRSQDETILQTNLEAAREIARQLRLRDIGGLVMIDFIDMEIHEHRRRVERELKAHLARDKARINVLPVSTLGVVEMTRQRVRHSLRKTLFERCPHCSGSGHIKSAESLGLEMLRELKSQLKDRSVRRVKVLLNSVNAFAILNQFRKDLVQMESAHDVSLEVCGDPHVSLSQMQVSTAKEGGEWVLKKVSEVDDYVRNS